MILREDMNTQLGHLQAILQLRSPKSAFENKIKQKGEWTHEVEIVRWCMDDSVAFLRYSSSIGGWDPHPDSYC